MTASGPPASPNSPTSDDARLLSFEAQAEDAYGRMYDATNASDATARYSDAKEAFHCAIGLAQQLGRTDVAMRLEARLAHVKAVFRSQF